MNSLLILVVIILSAQAYASDNIIALPNADWIDKRDLYPSQLLDAVLKETEKEYGSYQLESPPQEMVRNRMLFELEQGNISVVATTFKPDWDGRSLVVPFPIYKGLASYRVFFNSKTSDIRKENIKTLEQIKKYKIGQGKQWSTVKVLEDHHFNIVRVDRFDSTAKMLNANRFDLLMRGPHELLSEYKDFRKTNSNIGIEERFAIFTYLPSYFIVTKHKPELAKRLEAGLKKMDEQGKIEKLLLQHHQDAIKLTYSNSRKLFYIENTNLKPDMLKNDRPYLLQQISKMIPTKT